MTIILIDEAHFIENDIVQIDAFKVIAGCEMVMKRLKRVSWLVASPGTHRRERIEGQFRLHLSPPL